MSANNGEVKAGAYSWRQVEGFMADRYIYNKLKRKGHSK